MSSRESDPVRMLGLVLLIFLVVTVSGIIYVITEMLSRMGEVS